MPENYLNVFIPGDYSSFFCCELWLSNKKHRILLHAIWIINAALRKHEAWPQYRCRECREKRASHLGTFLFVVLLRFKQTNNLNYLFVHLSFLAWSVWCLDAYLRAEHTGFLWWHWELRKHWPVREDIGTQHQCELEPLGGKQHHQFHNNGTLTIYFGTDCIFYTVVLFILRSFYIFTTINIYTHTQTHY